MPQETEAIRNVNMKKYMKATKFVICMAVIMLLTAGCEKNILNHSNVSTEAVIRDSADTQIFHGTASEITAEEDNIIKIALIDTGIAVDAINGEHVLAGWNYCENSDNTEDTIGHGTALASLILGSDKADITGGAPEAYIVPLVCQVKDDAGELQKVEPEQLAQLIEDAVLKYDCNIINISAGVKTDSDVLREAVKYADEQGVLIIASAGNEGNSDVYYPGGYDEVLCIGSANKEMAGRADFSQENETVDLLAPGEEVMVATMKGNPMKVEGTSYSAAYMTAVAAKLWQEQRESTAAELIEKIMEYTVSVGDNHILSLE